MDDKTIKHFEKIIKTLLKNVTTKNDLWLLEARIEKRFATKDDLKHLATKDDLRRFATKDELKLFATKDDMNSLEKNMMIKFTGIEEKLNNLSSTQTTIMENLEKKADKDEVQRIVKNIEKLERKVHIN